MRRKLTPAEQEAVNRTRELNRIEKLKTKAASDLRDRGGIPAKQTLTKRNKDIDAKIDRMRANERKARQSRIKRAQSIRIGDRRGRF